MARFDLVCNDCKHSFQVTTKGAIKKRHKRCPECASESVRQTLLSYMRNGSLSNPDCGAPPSCNTNYG